MVNDNNRFWQIAVSPYYLLTREVCYTLNDDYFTYNNTGSEQVYEVIVRTGFTREESQDFSRTTGLAISTSVGLKIGAKVGAEADVGFGSVNAEVSSEMSFDITASASLTVGYSTSHSLSRHNEAEIKRTVSCPKYTSLAVWTQTSKFTLSRLDGSLLKKWEVLEGGIFIDECSIPQKQ